MKHKMPGLSFVVLSLLLASGCDLREPDSVANTPSGTEAAVQQPVVPAEAPALKPDSVDQDALKAGLEIMVPRIGAKVEPYRPIAALPTNRLLLHPGDDKAAAVEIDVNGLSHLTLSPYIEFLGGSADCTNNPDAGVVEFSWALDDGGAHKLVVDRNYSAVISVEPGAAKKLRIEVSKGNGVTWCDWASVGFSEVSPAPANSAAQ